MSPPATATRPWPWPIDPDALPPPITTRPGCTTWAGGIQAMGPLLRIPGRTLWIPEHTGDATQHAAAVLAALRHITETT